MGSGREVGGESGTAVRGLWVTGRLIDWGPDSRCHRFERAAETPRQGPQGLREPEAPRTNRRPEIDPGA